MPHRRQNAQGDGNDHRHSNGQGGEQQGCRQLGNEGAEHLFPGNVADAHVSAHHAAYPGKVLGEEGLIKTQFCLFCRDDLLRHRALITVKLDNGVTAGKAHHGKGQKGDADEHGNQL